MMLSAPFAASTDGFSWATAPVSPTNQAIDDFDLMRLQSRRTLTAICCCCSGRMLLVAVPMLVLKLPLLLLVVPRMVLPPLATVFAMADDRDSSSR